MYLECSKLVTQKYSIILLMATKLLGPSIRKHIYNIYGFVRFADEIVDTFHDYSKRELLDRFEEELAYALEHKISLSPILNSFQATVHQFNMGMTLLQPFYKVCVGIWTSKTINTY